MTDDLQALPIFEIKPSSLKLPGKNLATQKRRKALQLERGIRRARWWINGAKWKLKTGAPGNTYGNGSPR